MSKRSLRVFSREFKHRMVLRLANGERVAALAEEARVKPQLLYDWRAAYRALGVAGLSRKRGRNPGWRRNQASAGLASSEAASSSDAASSSAKPADELAKAQARIADSSAWSAGSRWICIFFAKPCGSGTRPARKAARPPLRGHPRNDRRRAARLPPE